MAEGNTGASLTREKSVYLTSQWCEAEPLCWTLSGLLPCSQVWWLGQGFCWWLWLLWVLGCPSLTPFLVFELFSSPLLLEEIASQSWPGNMIYNLWRRIRSLKLISQRTQESQSCRSLHVFGKSGLLTVPYHWARKQRLQGTVCKTIICLNLGVGQGPKFQWVRSW